MARLRRPKLPPGPLDDLVAELHALHARAGLPSTRLLATGQRFTYDTVHEVFTKAEDRNRLVPSLGRDRGFRSAAVLGAQAIGIATIATGIESAEQLALLRSIGIQSCQGYVFGRPMSPGELRGVLAAPARPPLG